MDVFGESGDGELLLEKYGLNEGNIIDKVKKILSK